MGFASITEEQARHAHHSHYTKPFEVVLMDRSGQWDHAPWSFIYGISDIGCWRGLISTDGEKVVVTRSSVLELTNVTKTFEFKKRDIKSLEFGTFKTIFDMPSSVKGLTKGKPPKSAILRLALEFLSCGLALVYYPFSSKKVFEARLKNEFNNVEKFKALLGK